MLESALDLNKWTAITLTNLVLLQKLASLPQSSTAARGGGGGGSGGGGSGGSATTAAGAASGAPLAVVW